MISGADPLGLVELTEWRATWPADAWREHLLLPDAAGEIEQFRIATQVGRPLGSEPFLAQLESATGRRLHPQPVGRPRKTTVRE